MDHLTLSSSRCAKVFIQRDYSEGTKVKFLRDFPQELEGKVYITLLLLVLLGRFPPSRVAGMVLNIILPLCPVQNVLLL